MFQFVLLASVLFSAIGFANAQEGGLTLPSEIKWDEISIWLAVSAAAAVSFSVMGAAYAIKTTGTAAISVLGENESGFFKAFLVVALGEALAVYGLIVAILLWTKIPDYAQFVTSP